MKIVGGIYGGRRLAVPKNRDIRPTTDKVRGAVFNMLASRDCIDGAVVLDAFCGTGALGLEALSRGAAQCTFMDKHRTSLDLARENVNALGVQDAQFISGDATKKLFTSDQKFSLVFLDPPYHRGLVRGTIDHLITAQILSSDAWIVCETERGAQGYVPDGFSLEQEKTYGEITVRILSSIAD